MAFEQYIKGKKAVIFGLDNVIYPEKDYLLQVYYLFSEFISYTEQIDAKEILAFMTNTYTESGEVDILEKTAAKFNFSLKYLSNFILLHQTARLPLKLLVYQKVLVFLKKLVVERMAIFIVVDGEPAIQLNKIKQTEWHGLEPYLKLYFTKEFEAKPAIKILTHILNEHELKNEELLIVGNGLIDEKFAANAGIEFLTITNLL